MQPRGDAGAVTGGRLCPRPSSRWHHEFGHAEHLAAEVRRAHLLAPGDLIDGAQLGDGELRGAEGRGKRGVREQVPGVLYGIAQ